VGFTLLEILNHFIDFLDVGLPALIPQGDDEISLIFISLHGFVEESICKESLVVVKENILFIEEKYNVGEFGDPFGLLLIVESPHTSFKQPIRVTC